QRKQLHKFGRPAAGPPVVGDRAPAKHHSELGQQLDAYLRRHDTSNDRRFYGSGTTGSRHATADVGYRGATNRLWAARPMAPLRSYSADSVIPMPSGSTDVRVFRQPHPP